jgi:hypothetical protein
MNAHPRKVSWHCADALNLIGIMMVFQMPVILAHRFLAQQAVAHPIAMVTALWMPATNAPMSLG